MTHSSGERVQDGQICPILSAVLLADWTNAFDTCIQCPSALISAFKNIRNAFLPDL